MSSPAGTKVGGFYEVYTYSVSDGTGVSHIETDCLNNDSKRYNLCGQRVDDNYKGFVIVNGRKFMAR